MRQFCMWKSRQPRKGFILFPFHLTHTHCHRTFPANGQFFTKWPSNMHERHPFREDNSIKWILVQYFRLIFSLNIPLAFFPWHLHFRPLPPHDIYTFVHKIKFNDHTRMFHLIVPFVLGMPWHQVEEAKWMAQKGGMVNNSGMDPTSSVV